MKNGRCTPREYAKLHGIPIEEVRRLAREGYIHGSRKDGIGRWSMPCNQPVSNTRKLTTIATILFRKSSKSVLGFIAALATIVIGAHFNLDEPKIKLYFTREEDFGYYDIYGNRVHQYSHTEPMITKYMIYLGFRNYGLISGRISNIESVSSSLTGNVSSTIEVDYPESIGFMEIDSAKVLVKVSSVGTMMQDVTKLNIYDDHGNIINVASLTSRYTAITLDFEDYVSPNGDTVRVLRRSRVQNQQPFE